MSKRKKTNLGSNERARLAYLGRRINEPLKVNGVGRGRLVTIAPKDFTRLNIDESYQRIQFKQDINALVHALRGGGTIPDPISVAERANGEWYIVDGQQRFAAHLEASMPVTAMIYSVETLDAEKSLFLAFNRARRVGADFLVHAWPGEIAEILRKANDSPTSMLYNKVDFGRHGKRIGAAILARAMVTVIGPADWTSRGRIEDILGRGDKLIAQPGARHRAESLLIVLASIFSGEDRLRMQPARAIASVARERWVERVVLPSAAVYARFRRVNWATVVTSLEERYFPVLRSEVSKKWR